MKKILLLIFLGILFQSCGMLGYVGFGPSMIFGGQSWKDPLGVQVGVETKILEVNENSTLSSGLNLTYQGAGYEEDYGEPGYGDMSLSGKVRLGYLNIPLIYTYQTNSKLYGEIGLQPGLLVLAKDKYNDESYDYMDYVNKFELGLPVGVGYHLNDDMSIGVRATYGITNLSNDNSDVADHNFLLVAMFRYNLNWAGK